MTVDDMRTYTRRVGKMAEALARLAAAPSGPRP
jgi:hypothetical protein